MSEKKTTATIMVVDDSPDNLKVLSEMLQDQGYHVQAFPGGDLALKGARIRPPDLILLDIMMPQMNGLEVCKQLKADDTLNEIPVLFISALNETADKVKAFAAGGVDYVTKPFQFEEVHARVQAHLEISRQRRELQEAYDKLRKLEHLRDNLTHMIIHDMNSPLTIAGGGLDLLKNKIANNDDASLQLWQKSKNAVHKLSAMCNRLLDVSRLEAGQMPVQRELCDLALVAAEAITAIEVQADFTATIRTELEPSNFAADKDLLHRVLVNLLTNAIKHTPEHGTITVRTKPTGDGVLVEVADTGPGISPEYHQQIFDKFCQVENRKDGQKHSSGLGLTFCQLAVEAHNGTIGVESEVGKGSTFWFTLPS